MEPLEEWLTQPEGLGTRLRALRVQAGLSGKDLADANGWAQSKVARLENGKQMPSAEDIEAWARVTVTDAETVRELLHKRDEARVAHATFRSRMARGQARVQQTYNDLVREASLIRHFETVYVPGLLQVPEYARRVFEEMIELHQLEIDDVDAALAVRMQRQQFLYDSTKRFEFLVAEPVLRFLLVSPTVMRAQLDRLQTVIGLEHVRFGIVPMGTVLRRTPQASVQIYVGTETIAVTEDFAGETWHRDNAGAYSRGVDKMWEEAVEGDRARELIIHTAQALPGLCALGARSSRVWTRMLIRQDRWGQKLEASRPPKLCQPMAQPSARAQCAVGGQPVMPCGLTVYAKQLDTRSGARRRRFGKSQPGWMEARSAARSVTMGAAL
jgi:transcriptional regulator with XRE-family HTH domain